jgi:hypothetical protein
VTRQLFIYWKLAPAEAAAAEERARQLQRQLREAHAGLRAGLFRRAEETGGTVTLMETYALPGPGVGPALQAAIEATMAPACPAPRHVEVFEELDG